MGHNLLTPTLKSLALALLCVYVRALLFNHIKNPPAMWETWVPSLGRRERLPTPVFWPAEFHGLYSPWSRKESSNIIQTIPKVQSFHKVVKNYFENTILEDTIYKGGSFNYKWGRRGEVNLFNLNLSKVL